MLKWEAALWLLSILLFGGWYRFSLPAVLWGSTYLAYLLIFFTSLPSLAPVFSRATSLHLEFRRLEAVFRHLERKVKAEKNPELARCCACFQNAQSRPSGYLKRIGRVCDALSIQGNALVHRRVNPLCPWTFFFVCRWEELSRHLTQEIPLWLETLGEVEAASALATLASNNPDSTLPHLDGQRAGASLYSRRAAKDQ